MCVWERATGRPLHRAIVWQDRRTAPRCAALARDARAATIRERTGLVLDPYFSATKMEWLMEHVLGVRERIEAGDAVFGTVDAWLLHRLTDGTTFATDHTNASRTMLYDLAAGGWSDELLGWFGVPRWALPEVRRSSGDFGVTAPRHFGAEIPITGIAGDQQAALFGQGCWTAGQAKNTYGTGAFLLLNTGGQRVTSAHGLLTTIGCDAAGAPAFALEGSVFIAGAAIQWLRDGLQILAAAAESERLAREVPDTGGVYFVPAFVGLGAPHWEPNARGTIVGLTRGTGRAHLVRAALESMAFSTQEVLDAMTADARLALAELQVDGGAAANDWLMQFQSDLLGVGVARPDLVETTALGAAGLAGISRRRLASRRRLPRRPPLRSVHPGNGSGRRAGAGGGMAARRAGGDPVGGRRPDSGSVRLPGVTPLTAGPPSFRLHAGLPYSSGAETGLEQRTRKAV